MNHSPVHRKIDHERKQNTTYVLHKIVHFNVSSNIGNWQSYPSQTIYPVQLFPFTHRGGCQDWADYYTRKSSSPTCRSMTALTDGSPIKINSSLKGCLLCRCTETAGCNSTDCQGQLTATATTQCIRATRERSYGNIWPQTEGYAKQNKTKFLV